MKQPKKPILAQKKILQSKGLDWKNWSVAQDRADKLIVINKKSGKRRGLVK